MCTLKSRSETTSSGHPKLLHCVLCPIKFYLLLDVLTHVSPIWSLSHYIPRLSPALPPFLSLSHPSHTAFSLVFSVRTVIKPPHTVETGKVLSQTYVGKSQPPWGEHAQTVRSPRVRAEGAPPSGRKHCHGQEVIAPSVMITYLFNYA